MGLAGVLGDGPCWASLGLSEPLGRRLGVVRGVWGSYGVCGVRGVWGVWGVWC